ncbi:MAG TPA: DUF4234 domain-containing protein [Candidatus Thermoplasmatota archaeon]|nr:DUF4234 domain-containing protein [Candidatus Thermoplasmatota archaeon]
MVLASKVGRKRSFGAGLLLTIVTFGIYAVYWNYRAHSELYRQYELAREGRDDGMVWYVLGLVLPPFLLAYLWVLASNVNYLRERVGVRRSMTPGRLVAIVGIGIGAIAVGIVVLQARITALGTDASEEEIQGVVESVGPLFLLLAVIAAALLAWAYAGLQKDINELWDAYDARMAYLNLHPEEVRRAEVAALPEAPHAAAMSAALRHEVDALRARHPRLRALAMLDALLARAAGGDAEAREEGERLLGDVAALLVERAELLRQRADQDAPELADKLDLLEQALFEESPPS